MNIVCVNNNEKSAQFTYPSVEISCVKIVSIYYCNYYVKWHFLIIIKIPTTIISVILKYRGRSQYCHRRDCWSPSIPPREISFNALTSERDAFTEARTDDDRSRIDRSCIEKQNAHHSFSSVKASRSVGRSNESHGGLYFATSLTRWHTTPIHNPQRRRYTMEYRHNQLTLVLVSIST